MTKKEKQLLLKDLCARLPYGVKCAAVTTNNEPNTIGGYCEVFDDFYIREVGGWFNISMIKPYLRPMSTMTNEEYNEYSLCDCSVIYDDGKVITDSGGTDWLMSHHFDYRGLIEMGLALEAPKDMYKN